MKRKINVLQTLSTFEGKTMKLTVKVDPKTGEVLEERDMTLRDGLLVYVRNANRMGLSDSEQNEVYTAGILIGRENEPVLTTSQYNTVRKITESGVIKGPNHTEEPAFNLEVKAQLFEMVDTAERVEEQPASETKPVEEKSS